jgi:quercetin dioxygenase-like cupin family protein
LLQDGAGAAFVRTLFSQASAQSNQAAFVQDLPDVDVRNRAVTVREINYQPGGYFSTVPSSRDHDLYVLEGEIRSKAGEGPAKTYGPGQIFIFYGDAWTAARCFRECARF